MQRISTERDDHAQRVEQLRSELARTGSHLHAFSEQRDQLREALERAEERARAAMRNEDELVRRLLLMRDLAHSLHDIVESNHVAIVTEGKHSLVRLSRRSLFGRNGGKLSVPSTQVLRRIAAVVAPHADARLVLRNRPDAPLSVEERRGELEQVARVLRKAGVAGTHMELEPAPANDLDEASPEPVEPVAHARPDRSWRQGVDSIEILVDVRLPPAPERRPPTTSAPTDTPADAANAEDRDVLPAPDDAG
jgi:hypothetical protein